MEDEQSSSIELSGGSTVMGIEVSTSLSSGTKTTQEKSGETEIQQEHQIEVSKSFECSSYTICSVQTWTYVAKIQGTCPRVPMVDPQCIKEEALKQICALGIYNEACPPPPPIELDFWESIEYLTYSRRKRKRAMPDQDQDMMLLYQSPLYKILEKNSWLQKNISLPSINEQWPSWTRIQQEYYNITKMDGSPAGQVLPEILSGDIWRASEDKYKIVYKSIDRCDFSTPLYLSKGKPKRTQVIIERPIDFASPRFTPQQFAKRWKKEIEVTILSNDLD
ncbi:hypothetical protein CDD81_7184 [Ophiocordyceps australis]|uniref:Uncharacterized protein n=1 Tax=Ophiocordyceps australis TaxID=1399860 RepID=A0A2C5XH35_9HYPO|nr:hypothetical protein CDD81_7184 [Ophiocordyceps australis]